MMCTMHRFWKISGVRQSICHPGTIEPRSHEPLAHRILVLTICTDTPHKIGRLLETESTHVHTNYALMNRAMGGASALQASRQCHLATLTGPTDSHSAVFWHGSRGEASAPFAKAGKLYIFAWYYMVAQPSARRHFGPKPETSVMECPRWRTSAMQHLIPKNYICEGN